MGRADQTTKVKGMFVRPEQIAEVGRLHPELGRLRLVVSREADTDRSDARVEAIANTLQALTKLRGSVELAAPGSLPNDGRVIADERTAT